MPKNKQEQFSIIGTMSNIDWDINWKNLQIVKDPTQNPLVIYTPSQTIPSNTTTDNNNIISAAQEISNLKTKVSYLECELSLKTIAIDELRREIRTVLEEVCKLNQIYQKQLEAVGISQNLIKEKEVDSYIGIEW